MTYPPQWRRIESADAATTLMREHPFANVVTAHGGLRSTRLPFLTDVEAGQPVRLHGHLNANNPQAAGLDGQDVLVTFSGPSSYVSPNWRTNLDRAGTVDYEEVQVRGRIRMVKDLQFFKDLVNGLAVLFERQHADIGDYPVWQTSMAPPGYIERLFPGIVAFTVDVASVDMVSKLHQSFSEDDRRSIARHLARSAKEDARTIAAKIIHALDGADAAAFAKPTQAADKSAIPRPDHTARPLQVTCETRINAEPAAVYAAWTDKFDIWFAQPGTLSMVVEPGRPYFFYNRTEWGRHPHYGRFLELIENELVEMTWLTGDGTPRGAQGAETILRVELAPMDNATQLRLTHSGFVSEDSQRAHDENWPLALEELDKALRGQA